MKSVYEFVKPQTATRLLFQDEVLLLKVLSETVPTRTQSQGTFSLELYECIITWNKLLSSDFPLSAL